MKPWDEPLDPQSDDYKYRKSLPQKMPSKGDFKVWNILKNSPSNELSKITMPVNFNEPISFLQRVSEYLEYAHLIHLANKSNDPITRMEYVAAFAVSAVASNNERVGKPFNPLLGETYELDRREERGYHIVCEQVSHHPPITAFHVDGGDIFRFHGSIQPKLKFWGKSVEITPKGYVTLELLNHKEVYTWRNVQCHVHNIIVGKLWVEHSGPMEIINHSNHYRADLDWKSTSWFTKDLHRVEGSIVDTKKNIKVKALYGRWIEAMYAVDIQIWDKFSKEAKKTSSYQTSNSPGTDNLINGAVAKLGSMNPFSGSSFTFNDDTPSSASFQHHSNHSPAGEGTVETVPQPLEVANHATSVESNPETASPGNAAIDCQGPCDLQLTGQRLLWTVTPRPVDSASFYNFSYFALSLNELASSDSIFPRTDSRWRPDMRLLEECNLGVKAQEKASEEKDRLEQKQRKVYKDRKKQKDGEWTPLWFKAATNQYTKKSDWFFNHQYFDRDYSKCPDIY